LLEYILCLNWGNG